MSITTVSVVGAKETTMKLDALAESMLNFSEPLEEAGQYWRDQVSRQFAAAGFVSGGSRPWAPLASYTIMDKNGNTRPLIRYGGLLGSYLIPGAPGNVTVVSRTTAHFGSAYQARNNSGNMKPIAMFHQVGTRVNGIPYMPARPIAFGTTRLDRQIVKGFVDYLFRAW